MNNKEIVKAAKATTNTMAQPEVNGRRFRPSHKLIDGSKDKTSFESQPSITHKDKMTRKKEEKTVIQIRETAIVRDVDKRKDGKHTNVMPRKQAASKPTETIITNAAKRLPKSIGSVLRESKNVPKTKEPTNKAKMTSNKTNTKASSITRMSVPNRTSHMVSAKAISAASISQQNVMNQVHNVTVSSPPTIRRDLIKDKEKLRAEKVEDVVTRDRTQTRTLAKEEVIIIMKPKTESTASMETPIPIGMEGSSDSERINVDIRQPISFEVHFNEEDRKQINKSRPVVTDEDTAEFYEDDFDSYESDFEVDLSSSDTNNAQRSAGSERSSPSVGDTFSSKSEMCDGTPLAEHPYDGDKMYDELNSDSYEMKPISLALTSQNENFNMDAQRPITGVTLHDSGIELLSEATNQLTSSDGGGLLSSLNKNNSKTFDNITDIEINSWDSPTNGNSISRKSALSKKATELNRRGAVLLKKITLDTMNYILYDCQPIPYDLFMEIFGKNNTAQVSTQTNTTRIDQETQLKSIDLADVWTQHPPTFYSRHMAANNFNEYKNGCSACAVHQPKAIETTLSDCVKRLQNYTMPIRKRVIEAQISATNYDHLNRFLLANEITISQLRKRNRNTGSHAQLYDSMIPDSFGYFPIELDLQEFEVLQLFATPTIPGFLFTLHHEIKGHLHLIAVWNLAFAENPICLLSSWTAVLCIEVHASARNLVFAGLDDGSIAIWDYAEAKYWHPPLAINHTIKRFVPSQVVTPIAENFTAQGVGDIGQVVAIRSIYAALDVELLNGYNPKQICSLHDIGLLVLWSVLDTSATNSNVELTDKRIDHQSGWSKVKLIQNKLIDFRSHVQSSTHFRPYRPTSSSFERTHLYFESDLFNDPALHELQTANLIDRKHFTNFRCVALELTRDDIIIATNENFILFGRKTMRSETFQKLQIDIVDHNGCIETLLALAHFEDGVVLAALRDGTVKSFCFDPCTRKPEPLSDCGDEPSISSAYSLLPMLPASAGQVSASSSISPTSTSAFIIGHDMVKSCTIQSIVQCERRLYDEVQALNNLDMNEYKTLFNADDADRSSQKFIRFVNDQIVMSNSLDHFARRRRQMVQLLKSNRLAMLHHGRLQLFEFRSNEISRINSSNHLELVEAASTTGDNHTDYLILLDENNGIQVHICTNNNNDNLK